MTSSKRLAEQQDAPSADEKVQSATTTKGLLKGVSKSVFERQKDLQKNNFDQPKLLLTTTQKPSQRLSEGNIGKWRENESDWHDKQTEVLQKKTYTHTLISELSSLSLSWRISSNTSRVAKNLNILRTSSRQRDKHSVVKENRELCLRCKDMSSASVL